MRDQNNVPMVNMVLCTDGKTIVNPIVNISTKGLKTNNGFAGSDFGPTNAIRDDNFVPVLMAVSSVDGKTPVAVYGTVNGEILIQTS